MYFRGFLDKIGNGGKVAWPHQIVTRRLRDALVSGCSVTPQSQSNGFNVKCPMPDRARIFDVGPHPAGGSALQLVYMFKSNFIDHVALSHGLFNLYQNPDEVIVNL